MQQLDTRRPPQHSTGSGRFFRRALRTVHMLGWVIVALAFAIGLLRGMLDTRGTIDGLDVVLVLIAGAGVWVARAEL